MNIDTDGRLVWTRVHRENFRDMPENFDFRKPGELFVKEYAAFIVHKSQKLGSAGRLLAKKKGHLADRSDGRCKDPGCSPGSLLNLLELLLCLQSMNA